MTDSTQGSVGPVAESHQMERPASQSTYSSIIRTPDHRVRVFISSTLQELAPERAAARQAVSDLRLTLPATFIGHTSTRATSS